jgi:S-adenosylmethionine hydrolase
MDDIKLKENGGVGMIAFISDWGYKSYYAGIAKSVIYSISPDSKVVDITHDIDAFDVEEASHFAERIFDYLPKGTVLLAVVDPGVGSPRKAAAVQIGERYCVVPDNGLLTRIIQKYEFKAYSIENEHYMYKIPPSRTFHGRDIFAPAAAYLDKGVKISEFGPELAKLITLEIPQPIVRNGRIEAHVAYIDSFGNVETIITQKDLANAQFPSNYILVNGQKSAIVNNYSENKNDIIIAHIDSSDYLELSSNGGRASEVLKVHKRDPIVIERF